MNCLLFFFLGMITLQAQMPNHTLFDKVLKQAVDERGMVDYASLAEDPSGLTDYLNELITNPPKDSWNRQEVLSYWINTYNAFTLKLVADHYPVSSIRDIRDPWKKEFIPFRGRRISLDHIEHEILRKMEEPRIHFAINCASISCPVLAGEAYKPGKLEEQLQNAAERFINDRERNRIAESELGLSKIFKWFRKDFTATGSLKEFIASYTPGTITPEAKVIFLDYNWDLNEQ